MAKEVPGVSNGAGCCGGKTTDKKHGLSCPLGICKKALSFDVKADPVSESCLAQPFWNSCCIWRLGRNKHAARSPNRGPEQWGICVP